MHSEMSSLWINFISVGLFFWFDIYGFYTYKPVFASQVLRPRGVPLAMSAFYDPSHPFTCFDGSGTFPFKYVNDDYCDCKDGSDEPGTAACLTGTFHCNNVGHVGKDISSSFINDGICDCCDTSDEYMSDADCLDVCHFLGEAARVEARYRAEMQLEGYSRRQKMAEEGIKMKKEKQVRIAELSKAKEQAELEQAEKLTAKEAAEEPEKMALEQYRAAEEEIKAKKETEEKRKDENNAREAFIHLDTNSDGVLTVEEVQSANIFDTNRDGMVSEEKAKFYMQQKESVDLEMFLASVWALMRPTYTHQKRLFIPPSSTEPPLYVASVPEENQFTETDAQEDDTEDKEYNSVFEAQEEELEEESEDYADELEDAEVTKEKDESEKEEEEERIHYDPETQRMIDLANAAREEYRKADDHLRDLTTEIQSLQEGVKKDFGPNEEFRVFEGQCYQFTDREYVYELCPFDKTTQKPKDGHGDTRLGTWGQWAGPAGNPYYVMKYTEGQACWNGPQRSAEVRLSCGKENELTSVTEPNRCEYLFMFTTPAVCFQPEGSGDSMHQHSEL